MRDVRGRIESNRAAAIQIAHQRIDSCNDDRARMPLECDHRVIGINRQACRYDSAIQPAVAQRVRQPSRIAGYTAHAPRGQRPDGQAHLVKTAIGRARLRRPRPRAVVAFVHEFAQRRQQAVRARRNVARRRQRHHQHRRRERHRTADQHLADTQFGKRADLEPQLRIDEADQHREEKTPRPYACRMWYAQANTQTPITMTTSAFA